MHQSDSIVFDFDALFKATRGDNAKKHVACETCGDAGWIDELLGGCATSGWAECPDCANINKEPRP